MQYCFFFQNLFLWIMYLHFVEKDQNGNKLLLNCDMKAVKLDCENWAATGEAWCSTIKPTSLDLAHSVLLLFKSLGLEFLKEDQLAARTPAFCYKLIMTHKQGERCWYLIGCWKKRTKKSCQTFSTRPKVCLEQMSNKKFWSLWTRNPTKTQQNQENLVLGLSVHFYLK